MSGMLARVDHFRGNVTQARLEYLRVIQLLDSVGNLRAKSYFLRHLAALETRLENFKEANIYARESKAIAASQNAPDLIAFATEMEGRALSAAKDNEGAIRKFRMALLEAQRLDISRLQADILLGIAKVQLRLGDAHAARRGAADVMEFANENLLVLRQIKAQVLFGKVAAEVGSIELARKILEQARRLAGESQFRLVENDAKDAFAELSVGASIQNDPIS
jgi:tetratricopeptide (TPR) repeat protein